MEEERNGLRPAGLKAKEGFCLGRIEEGKKQGYKISGVPMTNTVKVKTKGKVSLKGRSKM